MNVIGLNAFHGDSSACLLVDGNMVAAAEEERFRRIKHWAGFPSEAIKFCLDSQGLTLSDIGIIAINSDAKAARAQKVKFLLSGQASLALISEKLKVRKKRKSIEQYLEEYFPKQVFSGKVEYVEHHKAHLSSAYSVSPYDSSSIISVDGFGDFASSAMALGKGGLIDIHKRIYFPHSLGVFYQALTQFLGFPYYGDEYKIMGLAPYGEPKYRDEMDEIVNQQLDGSFKLNLRYFLHHKRPIGYEWDDGVPLVGQLFHPSLEDLFGVPRKPDQKLTQKHKDIARSVQDCYERAFFHMLNSLHEKHKSELGENHDVLTIAGGCGMNSVANGKVHLNTPYKNIYIQSAAGDAGGAIGAAMLVHQKYHSKESSRSVMSHSYWGPSFDNDHLKGVIEHYQEDLISQGCDITFDLTTASLVDKVSDAIIDGQVIGWFQGAMEWGPRALGNRSILGDPRRHDMKDILNLKIKRRESFRPFAPSVLREQVSDWFESDAEVPFMMKVFQIKEDKRSQIPAVTHVDGSGRLQTVTEQSNKRYYQLIKSFFEKTQVPMLLNTSFNENEPVVCKPEEAMECFMRTSMDVLVLGSHLIIRGH